jgi:hypothetical protein
MSPNEVLEVIKEGSKTFRRDRLKVNNISAISWRSVLLVEETGVPGGNQRPVANH